MTRYLLDSGIASDFVNNRGPVRERAKAARTQGNRIGLGTPVLGELIAGIQKSNDPARHLARLWHEVSRLVFWSFDKPAAVEYGRIHFELLRRGRTIQTVDMQIAAIALCLGNCTVVSKDSDLHAVPGLAVEDWSR